MGNIDSEKGFVDKRIEDLEVRYAFQEETLRQLDLVVAELGNELRRLKRELKEVRAQVADSPQGGQNKLEDEKPPHY